MKVLLIEPDAGSAQTIELFLKIEGFNVFTTDTGEEACDLLKLYDYDACVLALDLPDMSGLDVLRTVRKAKVKAPILILSGGSSVEDEVKTLSLGADDFIRKPFHRDVLAHRLRAVIRRSAGHAAEVIEVGAITVDIGSKTGRVNGAPVHLTGRHYAMLELMALRTGATLTKEMFLNHLYGGMDEPELKIIDVFICKLRAALGPAAGQIETVWGRGYRLVAEPAREYGNRPVIAPRPDGLRGRLLARLETGEASFVDLAMRRGRSPVESIRGTISLLLRDGLIENIGGPRAAIYRLKSRAEAA